MKPDDMQTLRCCIAALCFMLADQLQETPTPNRLEIGSLIAMGDIMNTELRRNDEEGGRK